MKREYVLVALFLLITAIFFYLFWRIMGPFFVPIAWAGVFVILFYPLYEKLLKRIRRSGVASFLMCILILFLIIGPVGYLLVALIREATEALMYVNTMYKSGELNQILSLDLPFIDSIKQTLGQYYDIESINLDNMARDAVEAASSFVVSQTTTVITNSARVVFYFVLMMFTMYYFFIDGDRLVGHLRKLMPLTPTQVNVTFKQLRDIIYATMYGGIVVALIQGLIGGILFAIMGIPSAIFWGAVMAFLSIIPIIGAFVVYIPAGIILILQGAWIKGVIVIGAGTIFISQVDNVLRPFLISGKTAMHPLLLFFSIMGGIAVFNLLGVVIGPMIAAVFVTLIRIFEFKLHPETATSIAAEAEE